MLRHAPAGMLLNGRNNNQGGVRGDLTSCRRAGAGRSCRRFRRRLRGNAAAGRRDRRPRGERRPAGRQVGTCFLPQGRGSDPHDQRGDGPVQQALRHQQGAERRRDDVPGRLQGIVGTFLEGRGQAARPTSGRPATRARRTIASSPMSMRIRSRRFGSIRTTRRAMERWSMSGAA